VDNWRPVSPPAPLGGAAGMGGEEGQAGYRTLLAFFSRFSTLDMGLSEVN